MRSTFKAALTAVAMLAAVGCQSCPFVKTGAAQTVCLPEEKLVADKNAKTIAISAATVKNTRAYPVSELR